MKDRIRVIKEDKIDKNFIRVTKRVTRTVTENIYKGVRIPDDIFDILYDLRTMDSLDKLDVFDSKLRELLVKEAGARGFGGMLYRTLDADEKKLDRFEKKMKKYFGRK